MFFKKNLLFLKTYLLYLTSSHWALVKCQHAGKTVSSGYDLSLFVLE